MCEGSSSQQEIDDWSENEQKVIFQNTEPSQPAPLALIYDSKKDREATCHFEQNSKGFHSDNYNTVDEE